MVMISLGLGVVLLDDDWKTKDDLLRMIVFRSIKKEMKQHDEKTLLKLRKKLKEGKYEII